MTDLDDRIDRIIAYLEAENCALQRLLESGHSLEDADRVLRGLGAGPGPGAPEPPAGARRDRAETT